MVKGKHGRATAVRHDAQSAAEQIETAQTAIARLTQELADARASLADQIARSREVERRLVAERDRGVSPKVEELEALLMKVRGDRDTLERKLNGQRKGDPAMVWMFNHLGAEHGMTGQQALGEVMQVCRLSAEESATFSRSLFRNTQLPGPAEAIRAQGGGR